MCLNLFEQRTVDALKRTGMANDTSKCLALLIRNPDGLMSAEMQKVACLRQPSVSVSVNELLDTGWVIAEPIKSGNRGRPNFKYRLAASPERIIQEIKLGEMRKSDAIIANLNDLEDSILS